MVPQKGDVSIRRVEYKGISRRMIAPKGDHPKVRWLKKEMPQCRVPEITSPGWNVMGREAWETHNRDGLR